MKNEDGDPVPVHLIYSAAAYARQHATGGWADMQPASLDLGEFLEGPLIGMHERGDLLGPDFNNSGPGIASSICSPVTAIDLRPGRHRLDE